MSKVDAKAYLSPSLVLLAMDWKGGEERSDFLGFAISRAPGFKNFVTNKISKSDWLPNRLSFDGPPPEGEPDPPSKTAPIQKFMWWDARLEGFKAGDRIKYSISPVCGTPEDNALVTDATVTLAITLPSHVDKGVGTWFNRAVMSSQAFSRKVFALKLGPGKAPNKAQTLELRSWLSNGMELPVPDLIQGKGNSIAGAIYHLTDNLWIRPALKSQMKKKKIELIYDSKVQKDKDGNVIENVSQGAIDELTNVTFHGRNKTNIMHNKFLVSGTNVLKKDGEALHLTCGSANYTTQGLTSQANLVHTFQSRPLAELYLERFRLLEGNPTKGKTAESTGWSNTVSVGDAGVRVFFSPEPGKPGDDSESIETIVQAIHGARSSVIFCLFTPTDQLLRDACFAAGDAGKMMFGLVNRISREEPEPKPTSTGKIPADQLAALEIYHRSKKAKDTIGAEFFGSKNIPEGFVREINAFPGEKLPPYPPVIIHHKFIVVDAETEAPVIYTGSANMSGNSVFGNDENLLEIRGSSRLAQIYLAEFLRLYEHYRARARYIKFKMSGKSGANSGFLLRPDRSWANKHYKPGTPEYKARLRMLSLG